MKPRILFLHEGSPVGGPRGGDKYWELLLERLSGQAEVVAVNRKVLGLSGIVSGRQYADALARHLATTAWRAPVLHDGSSFYQMTETNHMLKKAGWGPIVSLMQEWLPAREHSFRARLHLNRYLFRYLHSVDAHVVVSGWLKQRMQRLGVKGSRIDVAHPGVATACFENAATPVRHPSSVLRIVSAGVYHRSKGQLLLVEALGELAKKAPDRIGAYRVDMYGAVTSEEQPYFDVVQRRIAELGLQSIVSAHGPLPQLQLWNVFGQADVFAFMAEGEGLALVVMEAMLHGCVPLVPRGSPMDDQLLHNGKFGEAVKTKPADVAAALEKIRGRLNANSTWTSEIAREAVRTTLTWPQAVEACAAHLTHRMGIT